MKSGGIDELVPPIVTSKPARGREMQTTTIPTDIFDTMKVKKTLGGEDITPEQEKPTDGTAEYYHEGYVDGKMYLVPDSNLEAMKDIINFKMRPRSSTRYKHQTSYELSDYDHFRGKLDGLFTKLDRIEELQSNKSDEEPEEVVPEPEEEELEHEEIIQKKLDEDEEPKEKSEVEDSEDRSEDEESKNEELKQKSHVEFEEESDVRYLRILVSGHFRKDQKPMFIVQEYNGEPNLFKNQKADFFSKQEDGNVNVFITGKFYNENMLEESDGNPVALLTEPVKIKIEMDKSKMYYDYFKDIYSMKNFDISFKGEFIENKVTNKITPFLTLGVEKRAQSENVLKIPNYERSYQNTYNKTMPPTTVLVYEPKYDANPFSQDLEYIGSRDIKESSEQENFNCQEVNEPLKETNAPQNDKSPYEVATSLSSSFTAEEYFGEGNRNEPINNPSDPPFQPSSIQSDILSIKASAEAVQIPVSDEKLNNQNTPNTKKSFKEGLLKKLLKGKFFITTVFEKTPSNESSEISGKSENINVKSTQSVTNIQETPPIEENLLENKTETTPKNKIRSIFHIFD